VKIENLQYDDPPVDGYHLDYEGDTNNFLHDKLISHRLTFFALKYLLDYIFAETTGGYNARLTNCNEVIEELRRDFGAGIRIEDYLVFESEGVIAFIERTADSTDGIFSVHYLIEPHNLPAIVKDKYKHRYSHYGKF